MVLRHTWDVFVNRRLNNYIEGGQIENENQEFNCDFFIYSSGICHFWGNNNRHKYLRLG